MNSIFAWNWSQIMPQAVRPAEHDQNPQKSRAVVNVTVKNVYGNEHRSGYDQLLVLIAIENPPRANGTDKPGLPRVSGEHSARLVLL